MTGARILVVEDDSLLAETLCDLMQEAGCEPVGPAATVDAALCLIDHARIDVAILDIRLVREMSYPVAHALRKQGIPLLFLKSYQQGDLPDDFEDAILVEKPFSSPRLVETVRRLAMG